MARVKCPICEKSFTSSEGMIKIGARYYCNGVCSQQKQLQDLDEQARRDVIQYMMNLTQESQPNPVWLKMIKQYHEESNYKYKGMLLTLIHVYERLGMEVKSLMHPVNIIPYYYEEAKNYHTVSMERKRKVEDFEAKGKQLFIKKEISGKAVQYLEDRTKLIKKIDLNDLDLEEEEDE